MLHKTGVVGVSIRDDIVRVLQLTYTKGVATVFAFGAAPLPKGAVVNGNVEDPVRVGETVRAVCEHAAPHAVDVTRGAACALPESKTFLRIMSLPRMPDDQVASAVKWEMEGYVPLPIDDVYYDYQHVPVLENGEEMMSIVVVAAARSVVDSYIIALKHAGLHVRCIEADSTADARAVVRPDASGGQMVVFCGDTSSRLAIVVAGVPIFAVSVPVGYQTFVTDVTRDLGVSVQEAQRLIAADGIGSYIVNDPLFDAVAPSARVLSDEIRKSADFCLQTLAQCQNVTSVVLCGKGATIKGLRSFLVKETGIPMVIADPWQNVQRAQDVLPPLSRTEALDAVTVIGLSSRTLTYADFD